MFACLAAIAAASPAAAQTATTVDYSVATAVGGRWTYTQSAGGSSASFATTPGLPLLTLTCNRPLRRVAIARPATGIAPYLMVWSSSMNRNVPAGYNPATKLLTAELSAYDKLLDALAFSRGRVVVAPSNGTALVVPAWPDIIRVIEDCRV
jgi:hypothetical protein